MEATEKRFNLGETEERRNREEWFDGPADAAGRLTPANRIGILSGPDRAAVQDSDPIRRCASLRDARRTAAGSPLLRSSKAETVPPSISVSPKLNGR